MSGLILAAPRPSPCFPLLLGYDSLRSGTWDGVSRMIPSNAVILPTSPLPGYGQSLQIVYAPKAEFLAQSSSFSSAQAKVFVGLPTEGSQELRLVVQNIQQNVKVAGSVFIDLQEYLMNSSKAAGLSSSLPFSRLDIRNNSNSKLVIINAPIGLTYNIQSCVNMSICIEQISAGTHFTCFTLLVQKHKY